MKTNPKWYEDQLKTPHWLSLAILFGVPPRMKPTKEKQELGETLTKHIKQYAESYGWSEELKDKLFKPKFPESAKSYYQEGNTSISIPTSDKVHNAY